MTPDPNQAGQFDPFAGWTSARDAYMDQWSKAMIDIVNSPEYASASAKSLDAYLSASAPFRSALEKAMTQVLTQLNMPTRADVTSLAERLTNIEMRLDDLDAKLDADKPAARSPRK